MLKRFKLLLLLFIVLIPIKNNADSKENPNGVNDQTFATELAKTEVDLSLASGWYNDESSIFTTLYDEYGKYRGYRTTQIFKNGVKDTTLEDYNENGAKVCSVFEMNTIDVEYEGSTHQAIDFICTQEVGNQNVAKVEGNKITLNKGYGKTDGYLVGVSVRNKTFENVKGGEVANDVVYIIDNEGGSGDIVDITTTPPEGESTSSGFDFKKFLPIIAIGGIGLVVILVIVVIILLIKKLLKKGKKNQQLQPQPQTQYQQVPQNQPPPKVIDNPFNNQVPPPQINQEPQIPQPFTTNEVVDPNETVRNLNPQDVTFEKTEIEVPYEEIQPANENKMSSKDLIAKIDQMYKKEE